VGGEPLEALHRRLYSGVLAAHLRPDLPYRPHVTVAAFADHADAQRVAGAFGPVDIPGRIPSVELAEINSGKLRGLESFPLGSS
jgi:2'-5' RNA ligase